jgi:hypothetical protein
MKQDFTTECAATALMTKLESTRDTQENLTNYGTLDEAKVSTTAFHRTWGNGD